MSDLSARERLLTYLAAAVALAIVLGYTVANPRTDRAARAATAQQPREVIVQLFQWSWASVAAECPTLAQIGYGAVQTSPPQEHVTGGGFEWWQDYQPVSYAVESRHGTRAEFAAMVTACHDVGVKVYADAVINHMTGAEAGTGWAGTTFTHYSYPGTYGPQDFHHCGIAVNDDIADYSDRTEVQQCELVNLADLATEKRVVRQRITAYLRDLQSLGVDGFRIDAAKHVAAVDIAAIVAGLAQPTTVYQEVIDSSGEPITPQEYTGAGKVLVFGYGRELGQQIQWGSAASLKTLGGPVDSSQAVVFVDNHDTQRHGGPQIATHERAMSYRLANIYLLAWPYGQPRVMSSYAFSDPDEGAPHDERGLVKPAACGTEPWVCEHRWPAIAGMVGFHNSARGQPVTGWWDDGANTLAFGRGDRAFLALNNAKEPLTGHTFSTALPAGVYCDVAAASGQPDRPLSSAASSAVDAPCPARSITVGTDGTFTADLEPFDAIAIHVGRQQ